MLMSSGRIAEAVPMLQRYLECEETAFGPESAEVIPPLLNLGLALVRTGELGHADELLRRACTLVDEHGGEANINYASSRCQYGVCLQAQGRWQDAIGPFEEALSFLVGRYGNRHPEVAVVTQNLANSLGGAGRPEAAMSAFERAAKAFEELEAPMQMIQCIGGMVMMQAGVDATAVAALLETNRARLATAVVDPGCRGTVQRLADSVLNVADKLPGHDEALALLRTLRAILEPIAEQPWTAVVDREFGRRLLAADDAATAETVWLAAHAKVAEVKERAAVAGLIAADLAELCERSGRDEDAARWRARAEAK